MNKRKSKQPQPISRQKTSRKSKTFTEIGGSPVPGFTLRHVLRGHTGEIDRIAWSPDGSYLASPSSDKTVRIWHTHSGACVHTLRGHTDEVASVAWSPDGLCLASASIDKTIRLWETANGRHMRSLNGHTSEVHSLAWSSNGKSLASSSEDGTIRIWDTGTWQDTSVLSVHRGNSWSLLWLDGVKLALGSGDYIVRLLDTTNGVIERTLEGHEEQPAHRDGVTGLVLVDRHYEVDG